MYQMNPMNWLVIFLFINMILIFLSMNFYWMFIKLYFSNSINKKIFKLLW